jgi:hypothetical protein
MKRKPPKIALERSFEEQMEDIISEKLTPTQAEQTPQPSRVRRQSKTPAGWHQMESLLDSLDNCFGNDYEDVSWAPYRIVNLLAQHPNLRPMFHGFRIWGGITAADWHDYWQSGTPGHGRVIARRHMVLAVSNKSIRVTRNVEPDDAA